jgi:hypothetical protein
MSIIYLARNPTSFALYSGPVQDYIDRVIAADVAAGNNLGLETAVRDAYSNFITSCIDNGSLGTSGGVLSQANSILKAAPIMMGARTISGAMVPLVGPTPIRGGTAGGWVYDRKLGLRGNGTNNFLDTQRAGNADPQNSKHVSCYVTSPATGNTTQVFIGDISSTVEGASLIYKIGALDGGNENIAMMANSPFPAITSAPSAAFGTGFLGISRSGANNANGIIYGVTSATTSTPSSAPAASNIAVFARTVAAPARFCNATINFYSIGTNIDLTLLNASLATLTAQIAAAIP